MNVFTNNIYKIRKPTVEKYGKFWIALCFKNFNSTFSSSLHLFSLKTLIKFI